MEAIHALLKKTRDVQVGRREMLTSDADSIGGSRGKVGRARKKNFEDVETASSRPGGIRGKIIAKLTPMTGGPFARESKETL